MFFFEMYGNGNSQRKEINYFLVLFILFFSANIIFSKSFVLTANDSFFCSTVPSTLALCISLHCEERKKMSSMFLILETIWAYSNPFSVENLAVVANIVLDQDIFTSTNVKRVGTERSVTRFEFQFINIIDLVELIRKLKILEAHFDRIIVEIQNKIKQRKKDGALLLQLHSHLFQTFYWLYFAYPLHLHQSIVFILHSYQ